MIIVYHYVKGVEQSADCHAFYKRRKVYIRPLLLWHKGDVSIILLYLTFQRLNKRLERPIATPFSRLWLYPILCNTKIILIHRNRWFQPVLKKYEKTCCLIPRLLGQVEKKAPPSFVDYKIHCIRSSLLRWWRTDASIVPYIGFHFLPVPMDRRSPIATRAFHAGIMSGILKAFLMFLAKVFNVSSLNI